MNRFRRFMPLLGSNKLITSLLCLTSVSAVTYNYTNTSILPSSNLLGFGGKKLKRSINQPCILALDLQYPFAEAPKQGFALGPQPMTLYDVIDTIMYAATDNNVYGIIANVSQRHQNWTLAQIQELQSALQYFRANGKTAVAYADTLGGIGSGMSNYVLSCLFDKIVVQQTCDFPLSGMYIENFFLKGLLDKLEIDFQVFRRKEYKNYLNNIVETGYTAAHRENVTGYASSMLEQAIQQIAIGRNISTQTVRNAMHNGVYTTDEALKLGLIDGIAYEHTLPEYCKKLCLDNKTKEIETSVRTLEPDDTGKLANIDPKSLAQSLVTEYSQLKTYRFTTYANEYKQQKELQHKALPRHHSRIALIYAVGPVTHEKPKRMGIFQESLIGTFHSTTLAKSIVRAARDDTVKAIVLRIDSPGGSVIASDTVYSAVHYASKVLNKPIICSYGNVSASGGVYSSVAADHIVANPGTITGSIGVISGKPAFGRMLKNKLDINADAIELEGNLGRTSSIALPLNAEHVAKYNQHIDIMYNTFVQHVADGRKQSFDTIEKLARGRVYTGEQAIKLGLIDTLGGLNTAIEHARTYVKDDKEREIIPVQVYPKPLSVWEQLIKQYKGVVEDAEKDTEPLFDGDDGTGGGMNAAAQLFDELCRTSSIVDTMLTQMQIPQIVEQLTKRNTVQAKCDQTETIKV